MIQLELPLDGILAAPLAVPPVESHAVVYFVPPVATPADSADSSAPAARSNEQVQRDERRQRSSAARPPSLRSRAAMLRFSRYLAVKLGARRRVRELHVVWNRRLRTALGRADFGARTIELNPTLLDRHPAELVPTLVHELCHLIVGPRAAHGSRWREAMRALGARAEACHRLDVRDLKVRRRVWLWTCTRCGAAYPRKSRSAVRYRCGRCRGKLAVGSTPHEP